MPADEVQQQVERALEGVEEDRERFRRNVEIGRELGEGLAADLRDRQREPERRLRAVDGIVRGTRRHRFFS